jgi:four helix bundle protein
MNSQHPTPNPGDNPGQKPKKVKPYDIRLRTFEFALRILEITSALPYTREAQIVREQLAKAGTSIGANVEEADGALSKAEKRKCLLVSRRESREARYWLKIVARRWSGLVCVDEDILEATELLYTLSSMVSKLGA